ncbi:hypothetical protein AXF42_Ash012645 [Apostasia shenzhenica]|uniref:Uncharacterized protein n=1 Tax=Apostasia shenzhenica TaxID=1088818 RepID=A0A2H9ZT90_9ASPA|nr:hypothetical protein AXF42_Ash012645 [Apostasia shenzhenica]
MQGKVTCIYPSGQFSLNAIMEGLAVDPSKLERSVNRKGEGHVRRDLPPSVSLGAVGLRGLNLDDIHDTAVDHPTRSKQHVYIIEVRPGDTCPVLDLLLAVEQAQRDTAGSLCVWIVGRYHRPQRFRRCAYLRGGAEKVEEEEEEEEEEGTMGRCH